MRQRPSVGCDVGPTVFAEALQLPASRHRLRRAEATLGSFDVHLAHRLAGYLYSDMARYRPTSAR